MAQVVSVEIRVFRVYSKCTDTTEVFQATYFYRYYFLADSEDSRTRVGRVWTAPRLEFIGDLTFLFGEGDPR